MPPKHVRPLSERINRDAIFGTAKNHPRVVEIDLTEIDSNPDQPRKRFDDEELQELARSIESVGLIQPITVKRIEDSERYLLVAGERRFRAHQVLGRESIFAIITEGDPAEIALIENMQRRDLNPVEEAAGVARLIETHGYSQGDVARVLGKSRPRINEILALNRLPEPVKEECRTSDTLSKSILLEIAKLKSEEEQLALFEKVKSGSTVRATRAQKRGESERRVHSPQEKMLSAGRSFLRTLKSVSADELTANQDQYEELVELRRLIDEQVAALTVDKNVT